MLDLTLGGNAGGGPYLLPGAPGGGGQGIGTAQLQPVLPLYYDTAAGLGVTDVYQWSCSGTAAGVADRESLLSL